MGEQGDVMIIKLVEGSGRVSNGESKSICVNWFQQRFLG